MKRLAPLVLLALAGCVPASMEKLEAEGETVVLATPLPWQEAYRRLNSQMRACLSVHGPLHAMAVDGQLYDELRMGEITMTYPTGPFSTRQGPWARVQVRPDESGTSVTVLASSFLAAKDLPSRVEAWLAGSTECR